MDFHTTDPYQASPFASTVDDPRELQKRVMAVMARAERRRAKIPQPGAYWEEPGHHGTGREVVLRKPRAIPLFPATKKKVHKALRLPPLPKPKRMSGDTVALIAVGVIGTGLLVGYLAGRHKRKLANGGTQVGDDMCGFDLLGCDS